jgi:putative Holliday junction resolvase
MPADMRRTLGLDVGEESIGLAISDRLGYTAQGLYTLIRTDINQDIDNLKKILKKYRIKEIVVGLPLNMDGSLGPSAERVNEFIKILKKNLKLPVKVWDERLSTLQAEGVLLEADLSRRKRKRVIDKLAAQLILQNYLESKAKDV